MTQTFLIGLSGRAGTGKDTVRKMLQDVGYTGFALADPIRSMLRTKLNYCGISHKYIDDRSYKETIIPELGVSYRHMAQSLGTEWGRNLQSDHWLRIAQSYLNDQVAMGGFNFCISDIRFPNEAQWVREQGGVIWRVERDPVPAVRDHASESEMASIEADTVIDNNGTIGDLHRAVVKALDGLN